MALSLMNITPQADVNNKKLVDAGWEKGVLEGTANSKFGFNPTTDLSYLSYYVRQNRRELVVLNQLRQMGEGYQYEARRAIMSYEPLLGILCEYAHLDQDGAFSIRDDVTVNVMEDGEPVTRSVLDDDGFSSRLCEQQACFGRLMNLDNEACRHKCSYSISHAPDGQALGPVAADGSIQVAVGNPAIRNNNCAVLVLFNQFFRIPQAPLASQTDRIYDIIPAALAYVVEHLDAVRKEMDGETPKDYKDWELLSAGWIESASGWSHPSIPSKVCTVEQAYEILRSQTDSKEDELPMATTTQFDDLTGAMMNAGMLNNRGLARMNASIAKTGVTGAAYNKEFLKRVQALVKRKDCKDELVQAALAGALDRCGLTESAPGGKRRRRKKKEVEVQPVAEVQSVQIAVAQEEPAAAPIVPAAPAAKAAKKHESTSALLAQLVDEIKVLKGLSEAEKQVIAALIAIRAPSR